MDWMALLKFENHLYRTLLDCNGCNFRFRLGKSKHILTLLVALFQVFLFEMRWQFLFNNSYTKIFICPTHSYLVTSNLRSSCRASVCRLAPERYSRILSLPEVLRGRILKCPYSSRIPLKPVPDRYFITTPIYYLNAGFYNLYTSIYVT